MKNRDLNNKINNMNNLVELHIHLDGALSIDNCKKIAKIQNISLPSDKEMFKLMRVPEGCKDLNEFLTKFDFALSLLQTREGIENAVSNLCDELINQGIIYVEIRFAPQLHTKKGLSQDDVVFSAIEGIKKSRLCSNLILCCMRGSDNHDENLETINVAKKYLGNGVCAIDLAGAEGLFPTKDFRDLFTYAKDLNIPFTIHAGEAAGAESVRDAILFGAKRIGHGVKSIENPNLIKEIREKGITLEICPTSNICTSIYNDISDMPIKYFLENNINITINTDDPTVCNTNLKEELKRVASAFDLDYDDIIKFQLNAIMSSFASVSIKEKLIKIIRENN